MGMIADTVEGWVVYVQYLNKNEKEGFIYNSCLVEYKMLKNVFKRVVGFNGSKADVTKEG